MKKHLRHFWYILILCILIPICFLIPKFSGYPFSDYISNWGVFGDYIGGVVGTIIALANLYVFVRLTMLVSESQTQANQQSIENQNRILLSQLRQNAVKEISKYLNTLGQDIKKSREQRTKVIQRITAAGGTPTAADLDDVDPVWEVVRLKQALNTFCKNQTHLFSNVECNVLNQELDSITAILRAQVFNHQAFSNTFATYLREKDLFIQKLHQQIIDGLKN